MNKIILTGNLTRDPERGVTNSGIDYCKFTLAVNRRFSNEKTETDYFNVTVWRGLADICAKSLKKGRKAGVVGTVQINNYEAQDGSKRTSVEIRADEVEFLSPKYEEAVVPTDTDMTAVSELTDDYLPF